MIGKTLSCLRIVNKLGEGGTGKTYKALDTRLDRSLALKVLGSAVVPATDLRLRIECDRPESISHAKTHTRSARNALPDSVFLCWPVYNCLFRTEHFYLKTSVSRCEYPGGMQ